MPFLVETPQTHLGIKLYVSPGILPSRAPRLHGIRAEAIEYRTRPEAVAARGRFSSLYRLDIVEVKENSHAL